MCILSVSVSDTVWCYSDLKTKSDVLGDVNRIPHQSGGIVRYRHF